MEEKSLSNHQGYRESYSEEHACLYKVMAIHPTVWTKVVDWEPDRPTSIKMTTNLQFWHLFESSHVLPFPVGYKYLELRSTQVICGCVKTTHSVCHMHTKTTDKIFSVATRRINIAWFYANVRPLHYKEQLEVLLYHVAQIGQLKKANTVGQEYVLKC